MLLLLAMAALWAALCFGLPTFGLSGAGAMLAHAHTHGGTAGMLALGLSVAFLVAGTTALSRREPVRGSTRIVTELVAIVVTAWAAILYLEWGHAWVAQGGAPRKALAGVALAIVWVVLLLAYRAWLARQIRRGERPGHLYVASDEDVRGGRG